MNPQGIYALDYSNTVWKLLLPPSKRLPKWLAWGASLAAGKQWKHNVNFGSYMLGSQDSSYNASSGGYSLGDRVIYYLQSGGAYYGDNAVYEAITSVPTNTPPTGTNVIPQIAPSWVVDSETGIKWIATGNNGSPFYWVQVQQNFIGVTERASYAANKIIMEYALNKWFNTTFRQPNSNSWYTAPPIAAGKNASDIFIVTNVDNQTQLWAAPTSAGVGYAGMPTLSALALFGAPPVSQAEFVYDFTIYIPTAVYAALSANSGLRLAIVQNFVNQLNIPGNKYNVLTY